MVALIVVAVLLLVGTAVVLVHNRFVTDRNTLTSSWANIETELQRRHDLVPNLVETVRGYASHERRTLDEVLHARAQATAPSVSPVAQAGAENALVMGLRQLLAVSEAYPDLRASEQFLELQRQLVSTENRIQAARRIYNGNVRDYNRLVESIPTNLVAKAFGFAHADYFELDPISSAASVPTVRY